MRATHVAPTGVERTFASDEIIVSKTDLKGFLTYTNDVFLRISAYSEEEVIGKPHNVICHPDMPRCVFRLLWQTIDAGDELFAYVVNLAGDGAHYWVLAHVTPSYDGGGRVVGHHSNRRLPDPGAVEVVAALYAELRGEERRHRDPSEGMAASAALLAQRLEEAGMTYDEYVWSLTPVEVGR